METTEQIINRCRALFEDLNFTAAREWKAALPGRRVIGFMPIYVPREIVHAAGMLPIGIFGGGDQLEVIQGDAYYQSYICRIPRSTIELILTKRLDFVDGMLFPSICDVIRNLSGMLKMIRPEVYSHYFDIPQNYQDGVGGGYRFSGNAKRMTLMDVIEVFEPFLIESAERRGPGMDTEIGKALNLVLDEINQTIHATLNSISIQTMLMMKDRVKRGLGAVAPKAATQDR